MLDWLKEILGDNYTEEIDKKISEKIGKDFVIRQDFNSINTDKKKLLEELETKKQELEALKSDQGDIGKLKAEILELQAKEKQKDETHKKEIESIKIDSAVNLALSQAKAKNLAATKALLKLEELKLDDTGNVEGLADQIKALSESAETSFLFNKAEQNVKGFVPGQAKDGNPGAKQPKDMNYDELCAYLNENPNQNLT